MPGEKILVVEDEAVVACDLEQTLVHLGYEVVAIAQSAAEAVGSKNSTGHLVRQIRGKGRRESHFFGREGDPSRQLKAASSCSAMESHYQGRYHTERPRRRTQGCEMGL